MISIFKRKKEKISIYRQILNCIEQDEKIDVKLEAVETKNDSIEDLKKALSDFYEKDKSAIEEFDLYFKNHEFEKIKDKFQSYLLSIDNFEAQRLVGLSILLMRDSYCKETIKCGIYLCNFYSLENTGAAIKILANLSLLDEFRDQAMGVLKTLGIYEPIRDSIFRKIEENRNRGKK